jgi:acetolactate synthase-1/2/3 large subunit
MRLSDYICNFLYEKNINTLFSVTGGFAMNLNDSFGILEREKEDFEILYQHHEQASGYSAVGYSKLKSKPCIVCTTAGSAATNAVSPCVDAYQDSVPILFISGQVKSNETTSYLKKEKNIDLRHYSGAEVDIISIVKPITKYAVQINDKKDIKFIMEKLYYELTNGRLGPVWLSVPSDIQSQILTDDIEYPVFKQTNYEEYDLSKLLDLKELFKKANRPMIVMGNGIRLSNTVDKFRKFIDEYKIPCVATFFGADLLENSNDMYVGRIGLVGERSGNFAVQNCDLLISLGSRMAQGLVGYNSQWFAREAKIVYFDIDEEELKKENVKYELKFKMDLRIFFDNIVLDKKEKNTEYNNWIKKCLHWKNKWFGDIPKDVDDVNGISPYYFLNKFCKKAPSNKVMITSSGSIYNIIWHSNIVKKNDRYLISSQGDMGFELPAAIGAQIGDKKKTIFPVIGDGSFQFNIQELQTIKHHKLPIKILLFNNLGYGAIYMTQEGFFKNIFGTSTESGLSFPNFKKIAETYNIDYYYIEKNEQIESNLEIIFNNPNACIIEIKVKIEVRHPKLGAVKNDDGTFTGQPYENMVPFLDKEELENEMIIKPF